MRRVLIADAQPLMRDALRGVVLSAWPKSQVVEIGNLAAMDEGCRFGATIDLVIMDPSLPGATGLAALIAVKQRLPHAPVVIFATRADDHMIGLSNALGASAYLHKSAGMAELTACLRSAVSGCGAFPALAERGVSSGDDITLLRKRLAGLTHTQMKVLLGVAGGRLNKQVAADLQVSEAAIKGHMTAIFRKLGVHNRAQAMLVVQPLLAQAA